MPFGSKKGGAQQGAQVPMPVQDPSVVLKEVLTGRVLCTDIIAASACASTETLPRAQTFAVCCSFAACTSGQAHCLYALNEQGVSNARYQVA